jgi:hypothetical protein
MDNHIDICNNAMIYLETYRSSSEEFSGIATLNLMEELFFSLIEINEVKNIFP